ncbi:MAG: hypothetical protein IAC51_02765 [bacterium]|uniref:Outer membrane protein beta-barrel domain-containing protein n=1 Tax=Candidatus Aphodosoma intestinipullorum TaxID=2840674 RepID=A0A940DJB3_9BACT|nr:hypothetical protein [Candidatus Aphodosoma intestinipullorum]
MKKMALLIMMLCAFVIARCETREQRAANPHEVKIGWGDYYSDTFLFLFANDYEFNPANPSEPGHTLDKHFTGSIFAEYQYRINSWLGVGAEVGFAGALVKERIEQLGYTEEFPWNTYRFYAIPNVRFTYLNTRYVNLYSGLGAGFVMQWDNSLLNPLREPSFTIDINLIGIAIGCEHFFVEGEFTPKINFRNIIGSPILTVAAGYRF